MNNTHTSATRSKFRSAAWTLAFVAAAACLEPYPPPPGTGDLRLLVVDGFLNSTNSIAQVKLSRTLPLGVTGPYPAEAGASVTVEDENGVRFNLPEVTPGTYRVTHNSLRIGGRYRLFIRTKDLEAYESDPVELKQSPILEDVFWVPDGNGITIKLDTRDPSGTTRYYQWFYSENWEYDADEFSLYYMRRGVPVQRSQSEHIHICYSSDESTRVLISTTSDQSGDFINDFPLLHIPAGSKKLSRLYSINVQQRALDEDAFNYWQQLQRTNENLGGLFDPLPTQVIGNIHTTNAPGRPVLGYFSGGGVQEKRIYINFSELPSPMRFVNRQFCPVDSVLVADLYLLLDGQPLMQPWGELTPIGYLATSATCLDCRTEGGVLQKPSFWPR